MAADRIASLTQSRPSAGGPAPLALDAFLTERVDPRSVLAYTAAVCILAFTLTHPVYLAVLAAATWAVVSSLVPSRAYRPYLAFGLAGALFPLVVNPLLSRAGTTVVLDGPVLPIVGHFTITAEAIAFGLGMGLRLFCVIGVFALCSTALGGDAMFRLLAPLSSRSALILALTVRLFPAIARDASRIMDAQRSRGQKLDSGTWLAKASARAPVMDSLLASSLERGMSIAEALESRGYGRPGRSRIPLARLRRRDGLLIAAAVLTLAFGALLALGPARYEYYPLLGNPARPVDAVLAPLLGALVALPALLGWGWTRSEWLRSRV